jgi:hypothetical protein
VGEPRPKQLSVRMTDKMYEDLRALAASDRRGIVSLVVIVLEDYIKTKGKIEHLPPEPPVERKKKDKA